MRTILCTRQRNVYLTFYTGSDKVVYIWWCFLFIKDAYELIIRH